MPRQTRFPCALSVAGSDCSGGAGVQGDVKTFAALGVYGAAVITAITVQNSRGVREVHELPPGVVAAQLDAVLEDLPISAVKIGMLASADIGIAVAERLRAHGARHIVLDTVMSAKGGHQLLCGNAVQALIKHLFPLATLITPNLPEAACLLQRDSITDPVEAIHALLALGAQAVLLKGGHAAGEEITDLLLLHGQRGACPLPPPARAHQAHAWHRLCALLGHRRRAGERTSPTPCRCGVRLLASGAITNAWPLGDGCGPVHHFWAVWGGGEEENKKEKEKEKE